MTNTNYAFRVCAKTATALSKYSNVATARILFGAPYDLQISSNSDSTMSLSWQDTSSIKKNFEIERSTNGASFALVKTVDASVGGPQYISTLVDNYSPGQLYYFRIRTKSTYNLSPYSSIVNTSVVFLSPVGLSILSSTPSHIVLQWIKGSDSTNTYRLQKQVGNQAFVDLAAVDGNSTTFIDSDLEPSQVYHYRVRGESGNIYSPYSPSLMVQFKLSDTYTLIHTMSSHTDRAGNAVFTANDKILVSSGSDRTVKFWDVDSGNLLQTIKLHGSTFANSPALSLYKNLLAVGDSMNIINIYDVNTITLLKTFRTTDGNDITGMSFSPDGELLGAVNTGRLTVWRVSDWSTVLEKSNDLQYSVSFSNDHQYVVCGSQLTGKATILRIATGDVVASLATSGAYTIWAVSYNPENTNIAIGGLENQVRVFPSSGGSALQKLIYNAAIYCLAYCPDGKVIAVGGDGRRINFWSQDHAVDMIIEPAPIFCLTYSHDGRYLVSGSADHNVRLYGTGNWIGTPY